MKIKTIVTCGLMTAVTAVLSPIAIPLPFSPVPVSLGFVAVFLCGGLLAPNAAFATQALYLLIGAVGLPVFTGFQGGLGKLIGPTGGYLAAYPIMAYIVAHFVKLGLSRRKTGFHIAMNACGMAVAALVGYGLGTAWFCYQQQVGVIPALLACVVPFIAPDAAKVALCAVAIPLLRTRLVRIGALA